MRRTTERTHLAVDSIGLPYPRYLGTVIRRSVLVWLLVRITYVVVLMAGVLSFGLLSLPEGISAGLHPAWTIRVFLVMVAAFLVWWDRRRSHELLLHANLGAAPGWFWTASLLTALVLDVAIQAILEML
ncbi:MAG: hypothetical protein GEU90_21050 [Gemmatimonas sp.]|nr:hypothetical protein [Gemmatimonas sp.]